MTGGNGELLDVSFCSDDIPERDRIPYVREVYGRAIVKHEIEPCLDSPFHWESTLRSMPGLGLASSVVSAVRTWRTPELVDSDDLVLNATVAGRRIVRQLGREAIAGPGEVVVSRSADVGACAVEANSQLVNIRVPLAAVGSTIAGIDAVLVRPLPAAGPLSLLLGYVGALQTSDALQRPETRRCAVDHVHDLVALVLGATRDGAMLARTRGVRAARLHAVKRDVMANLGARGLSLAAVATRHKISPSYVRKLFEGEGTSFTDFVLNERLARAHRLLADPRNAGRTIGDIAFEAGFGDLSYFNRAFRRRFDDTPSGIRARASAASMQDLA
ncbi:MAG TPA: AraC family transcriptional regulator [Xanthobacteraceae bacterium]|jgi:AraC-like DNA-binding protein|nr:AraC family transcriptional regulator [Xanthobacteraceae bacterium]